MLWIWGTVLGASALVIKVKGTPNLQVEQNKQLTTVADYLRILLLASIEHSKCWSVGSNLTAFVGVPSGIPGADHTRAAKITQEAW